MELKIKVSTPKGYAGSKSKTMWILKKILFRKGKIKKEIVSKDRDSIIYIVEVHSRHYLKIVRNLGVFDGLASAISKNRFAKKGLKRLADSEEDYKLVMELLKNETKVELLKSTDSI